MNRIVRCWFVFVFILMASGVYMTGCASAPVAFNPDVSGPQLIVEPEALRLGVARVLGTEIVFRGKGFQPGEKVMIVLAGMDSGNTDIRIPVGFGETDDSTEFAVTVEKMTKIMNILQADFGVGEKGTFVILSGPAIPVGRYQATATGYDSDRRATCDLELRSPGLVDKLKDWVGGLLGKIQKS
jgi:hypothetical protein